MIYLDNAASSHPKPPTVWKAVARQLRENGANPGRSGHAMSMAAARVIFNTREKLGRLFDSETETVLFTQNTTGAINLAVRGFLNPGDHVLISDLEHNSVLRPLTGLEPEGISFTVVETSSDDEETVRRFRNALLPATKMILCTHASNVTGQILPIRALGELCRKQGILMGVDAAQTAGTERISLKRDFIDFLCIPGHKGLLGPQGTGALLLAQNYDLNPLTEGGTGSESLSFTQPRTYPEGYESGTMNTPGIAGLGAALSYLTPRQEKIRRKEQLLREQFLSEIAGANGYRILGGGEEFVGTVSLAHESAHSEKISSWLDGNGICVRGGFHCAALAHRKLNTTGSGAVRISFGAQNTAQEVSECVKCLKNYQNY